MCLHNTKHLPCTNKIRTSSKLILILWGSHDNVLHTDSVPPLGGVKHTVSKGSMLVDNHICEDS